MAIEEEIPVTPRELKQPTIARKASRAAREDREE